MKATMLQILDKKSPLFLIKIAVLLISVILKLQEQQSAPNCQSKSSINTFVIVVIVAFSFEVGMKVLLIEVAQCICTLSEKVKFVAFVACYMGELASLIMGLTIILSKDFASNCKLYEPHYTFVQFFVTLYTIVEVGVVLYLADTVCSKNVITVLDQAHQDNSLY